MSPSKNRRRILRLQKRRQRAEAVRELGNLERAIEQLKKELRVILAQNHRREQVAHASRKNSAMHKRARAGRLAMQAVLEQNLYRSLARDKTQIDKLTREIRTHEAHLETVRETIRSAEQALVILDALDKRT